MKKNKYALLIVSVCFIAFIAGIGAYNDTSLYWYFPKDVGIYTTSPGAELHVAGTTPQVRIGDDDAEDTAITFMGNAQDFYIALDDTTDDLTIGTGTSIGSNVKMVIENSSNVGIGLANPSEELHIYANKPTLKLESAVANNDAIIVLTNDARNVSIGIDGTESDKFFIRNDAGLAADSSVIITIDSSNNIGINTISPGGQLDISPGTTGGLYFEVGEATVNMSDTNAVTCQVNVPSGSKIIGCQLRVDTALAGGDTWDAAYSGGSTQSIASNQAVTKNTKVNAFYDENAASANISSEADVVISKNGGGHFTAQGTIRAIVYYNAFTAMGDAS